MRSVFGKVWVGITVPLLVLALVTHPGFWDTTRSAPVAIACVDLVAAVVSKGNCCCPWPRNTLTTACVTQNDLCAWLCAVRQVLVLISGAKTGFWARMARRHWCHIVSVLCLILIAAPTIVQLPHSRSLCTCSLVSHSAPRPPQGLRLLCEATAPHPGVDSLLCNEEGVVHDNGSILGVVMVAASWAASALAAPTPSHRDTDDIPHHQIAPHLLHACFQVNWVATSIYAATLGVLSLLGTQQPNSTQRMQPARPHSLACTPNPHPLQRLRAPEASQCRQHLLLSTSSQPVESAYCTSTTRDAPSCPVLSSCVRCSKSFCWFQRLLHH